MRQSGRGATLRGLQAAGQGHTQGAQTKTQDGGDRLTEQPQAFKQAFPSDETKDKYLPRGSALEATCSSCGGESRLHELEGLEVLELEQALL
jgi:hypothetical protein